MFMNLLVAVDFSYSSRILMDNVALKFSDGEHYGDLSHEYGQYNRKPGLNDGPTRTPASENVIVLVHHKQDTRFGHDFGVPDWS